MRKASETRKTRETKVEMDINLDGKGEYDINTGIGFFNHMLESIVKHSLIDMTLNGSGDIHVDYHHLVEDTGITFGRVVNKALGDKRGIRRFGFALVPLDEALVEAVIDISGRPHLSTNLINYNGQIGEFNFELGEVFFSGFVSQGYTLHLTVKSGVNLHHVMEASAKAFARALRMAVEKDRRIGDTIPSTKDYIEERE